MYEPPRNKDDIHYDLGERVGKGLLRVHDKKMEQYYMNKRAFYNGYIKGREQAIQEAEEKEMHSTMQNKSAMQKENTMQKCKHCGSNNIYLKPNAMHIEVRCKNCGKWNKFVGVEEKNEMLRIGVPMEDLPSCATFKQHVDEYIAKKDDVPW